MGDDVPALQSAGLLMYRRHEPAPEVLLVHPGGPFWRNKDAGAWSIPKGLYDADEQPLVAARREFEEETGRHVEGEFVALGSFRQPGGKIITAFAVEGDFDVIALRSNTFTIEWPPRSGRLASFPEVDRAEWFSPECASEKILPGQRPFIERLLEHVAQQGAPLLRKGRARTKK
jgi:predicted NUDIX family NTP pyrophosphohydrolase